MFMVSRRSAVTGAAAAGVGVPLLAACGSDDSNDSATDPGSSTPSSSESPSASDSASGSASESASKSGGSSGGIPSSDVPVGSGVVLTDQQVVVTQPSNGEFNAFSAVCTHQGCLVGDVTDTINCHCHGSAFSIDDGTPVAGPASTPLDRLQVKVKGDEVIAG